MYTRRERENGEDLGYVRLEVGDKAVHGIGVVSEGLGGTVNAVGKDSKAEMPCL